MVNGLTISCGDFQKLPRIQKDTVIYENLLYIRKKLDNYNLNKKIQYLWLSVLTAVTGLRKYLPL
jgi:hypothetical protein